MPGAGKTLNSSHLFPAALHAVSRVGDAQLQLQ
ncbi:hypothetical protein CGMCC3_g4003 [Colletotrichum fructicola]|nr:uncharacterized protein CGMCC3_g4003 [Colletotrichum fructicola]KAE9580254.1 hypothetical protein CGMCC3_g4003 [Colletotrichum fructicola]